MIQPAILLTSLIFSLDILTAQKLNRSGAYSWDGPFSAKYWVDPPEKLILLIYMHIWGLPTRELDEKFRILAYQALNN